MIHGLAAELAHAVALLGRDSTNTSTPTSQTPPWKDRHIPNSRRNTGKPKGGQHGHERHTLEKPGPEEVDEEVSHPVGDGEFCPECGCGDFTFTGEYEEKYEIDIKVKVIKRLHKFWLYQCRNCGQVVRTGIKSRICLRFYGDETAAYYVAHNKKDMDGILADGILEALTEMTRVMHDHNSINYNSRFVFMNLECNAHLQRDLQKSADETGHKVLLEIKQLVSGTIRDRNDRILSGEESFGEAYIENFNKKMTELLGKAEGEAAANTSGYSGPFERALIARIIDYQENYSSCAVGYSKEYTTHSSIRKIRADALLCLLTQPHFTH